MENLQGHQVTGRVYPGNGPTPSWPKAQIISSFLFPSKFPIYPQRNLNDTLRRIDSSAGREGTGAHPSLGSTSRLDVEMLSLMIQPL